MKYLAICVLLLCLAASVYGQESEVKPNAEKKETFWESFKEKVKTVLSKWKEDIKSLWSDVLAKADDMKGWTSDMIDSFKRKLKDWLESRPEVNEDEKNEIETFINKLKVPTEKPTSKPKIIDP